jgi:hypothetical protein
MPLVHKLLVPHKLLQQLVIGIVLSWLAMHELGLMVLSFACDMAFKLALLRSFHFKFKPLYLSQGYSFALQHHQHRYLNHPTRFGAFVSISTFQSPSSLGIFASQF